VALRLTSFAQGIRLGVAEGHERACEAGESNGCDVLTKYPKTLPELIFT